MTCATCRGTQMIGTFDFPTPGNEPRPCPDCDLNTLRERRDFALKSVFDHRSRARNAKTLAAAKGEMEIEDHYLRVVLETCERIRALTDNTPKKEQQ